MSTRDNLRRVTRTGARTRLILAGFMLCAGVWGCVPRTDLMDYRKDEGLALQAPKPGKALVVFMRPERAAGYASSSIFDDLSLVAVLMDFTYAAYETSPGDHRFMILGEAADFMDATLEAGKVYFARATPRWGVWVARFSLLPITPNDEQWTDIRDWLGDSYLVTLNQTGMSWAQEHAESIREKHDSYLEKWLTKDERPKLYAEEGVPIQDIP